jgi:hypothetical protein
MKITSMLFLSALMLSASLVGVTAPASAQNAAEKSETAAPAANKGADYEQRLELAKKMSEISPTIDQVKAAINTGSQQIPADKREQFRAQMLKSIDVKAIEQHSAKTMAEIFTKPELEGMVAYYSSPEARSAAEKMPLYNAAMSPIVVQMLDKAAMEARTGLSEPVKPQ